MFSINFIKIGLTFVYLIFVINMKKVCYKRIAELNVAFKIYEYLKFYTKPNPNQNVTKFIGN